MAVEIDNRDLTDVSLKKLAEHIDKLQDTLDLLVDQSNENNERISGYLKVAHSRINRLEKEVYGQSED